MKMVFSEFGVNELDKRDIFDQVESIEKQIGVLYQEIGQLKQQIKSLIERNQQLTLENHHLRERLQNREHTRLRAEKPSDSRKGRAKVVGEGYDNLARLYYEGFHICNQYYGSLRTEGDCLFCLTFLNKSG